MRAKARLMRCKQILDIAVPRKITLEMDGMLRQQPYPMIVSTGNISDAFDFDRLDTLLRILLNKHHDTTWSSFALEAHLAGADEVLAVRVVA